MELLMKVDPTLIKKLREAKAWSQDHLAQVSGLSLRTIQRVEADGTASAETKMAIASAFDIAAEELTPKPSMEKAVSRSEAKQQGKGLLGWLKSKFSHPKLSGPPVTIRRFQTGDATLSKDSISVEQDRWDIDAKGDVTIRLFEVKDPGAEQCLITYRATMKAEGLSGRAYLEMWCRLPGRGEFFSKGLNQAITGTTGWVSYEIPFYLKKGQRPDLIKLNLVIEGSGRVSIKDVELFKTPLES